MSTKLWEAEAAKKKVLLNVWACVVVGEYAVEYSHNSSMKNYWLVFDFFLTRQINNIEQFPEFIRREMIWARLRMGRGVFNFMQFFMHFYSLVFGHVMWSHCCWLHKFGCDVNQFWRENELVYLSHHRQNIFIYALTHMFAETSISLFTQFGAWVWETMDKVKTFTRTHTQN